jgi:glycine/D-amino acid oxidase-like deaminating enzyme
MEQIADENSNVFRMNRRGYLYLTADDNKIQKWKDRFIKTDQPGIDPLRIHTLTETNFQPAAFEGFHDQPDGADLLLGNELIRKHFPYVTETAVAALYVRRAGWLSAQQLGMVLLETARHLGVQFETARLDSMDISNNTISGIKLSTGESIDCLFFVNAAGPFLKQVGKMLGVVIPVQSELHLKVSFKDHLGVVSRDAPLLIWDDEQSLPWKPDEKAFFDSDPETTWLTKSFPGGVHTRPEGTGGNQTLLMLWEYKTRTMEPAFPIPLDDLFPEIVLRGLSTMLPRLGEYFGRFSRPQIDGGYYIKTRENRLLVGPLPIKGAYIIGASSGYGIMAACAAGELLSNHITGSKLPSYAHNFSLERYESEDYLKLLDNWGESGQL